MTGPLLAALGLALIAWHLKALSGRISLHPRPLKTPPGSAAVFALGAAAFAAGGTLTVYGWGAGGIFPLILLAIAFVVTLLAGSAPRALAMELRKSYEDRRNAYPALDDEALFRFIIRDRHPEWDDSKILSVTDGCGSLEELALRLKGEER